MKVTFESTPNPSTMKFNFGQKISDQSVDFPNVDACEKSPLAAKIFGFPWTASVYLGEDFVTVTKQDWVDWDILATPLAGLLGEHVESGQPVLLQLEASLDENQNDSDVVKQIKRILQNEIKPVVALDGGDIVFSKYEDHVLYIHMRGACAGCPSSQATLKDGIEVRMKELIPEIKEVVAI
ncbi:NifU family protein [Pseudobdellovibrio exovorus]|uniref:NifU related protein n=1 Tax=Pseudobdellovibrio exovorus JSS TaxID=1184267 RepID=M4VB37_9BACT|nr:NifU family protein [Pseudobdellovibrio exovorus]AGH95236.1 nifU related protein [Pseudobdellovibrio exovorus JSS]